MKWRELRAFLNMKFHDNDSISLMSDYDSAKVIIIKNSEFTESESILLIDRESFSQNDNTSSINNMTRDKVLEYTENEISTYFGGFCKTK